MSCTSPLGTILGLLAHAAAHVAIPSLLFLAVLARVKLAWACHPCCNNTSRCRVARPRESDPPILPGKQKAVSLQKGKKGNEIKLLTLKLIINYLHSSQWSKETWTLSSNSQPKEVRRKQEAAGAVLPFTSSIRSTASTDTAGQENPDLSTGHMCTKSGIYMDNAS